MVQRARATGVEVALADLSLAAVAARGGRFASPVRDPRSPLSTLAAGVFYPVGGLSRRLADLATAAGVRTARDISGAALVIEAHGDIGAAADWDDWSGWLPCSRMAVTRASIADTPPPYAVHAAEPGGWRASVLGYTARYTPGGKGVSYCNGVRCGAWRGNRVAVGAAAGVVEPVLGNALTLLHDALRRLVGLLPNDPGDMTVEAHEYNRLTRLAYEGARDAAVAVWATNARAGEPLWDLARDAAPPTLARRLALYRSRGYVPPAEDHDALTPADWSILLDGQGIRPRRLHPLATAIPAGAALAHVGRVHSRLSAAAAAMPTHAAVLARMEESR